MRVEVGNQAPVAPAVEQVHVGDVAGPNLFGPTDCQVFNQVGAAKQRRAGVRGDYAPFVAAND